METWKVETDDDGNRVEVHSFRPAALTTPNGRNAAKTLAVNSTSTPEEGDPAPVTAPGVVVIHGTLVTDALYRPFARNLSLLLSRPVHCYNGAAAPAPRRSRTTTRWRPRSGTSPP